MCHILKCNLIAYAVTLLNITLHNIVNKLGYVVAAVFNRLKFRKTATPLILIKSITSKSFCLCRLSYGINILNFAEFKEREWKELYLLFSA